MAKIVLAWGPRLGAMVPAAGVALFGIAVACALLAPRTPAWVVPDPGAPGIALATAAGFVLAGIALFASAQHGPRWARVRFAALLLLVALAGMALLQIATGVSLGIDLPDLHRGITPLSATPGRMSPPTAIAFLLTAALAAGFDRPTDRGRAFIVQLLAGALLALAIISIIMHDVSTEGLLPWYRYSRMAQPTAAAFLAIGASILALVAGSPWYSQVYSGREDEKMLILATGILVLALVGTTAAAFAAMQRTLESALGRTLTQQVSERAALVENLVTTRTKRAELVAERPELVSGLARFERKSSQTAGERLADAAGLASATGLRGVTIRDGHDRVVARAGVLSDKPEVVIPLASGRGEASLAWDGGALLRTRLDVRSGGAYLGTVWIDDELPLLTHLHSEVRQLGRTAEWELCGRARNRVECIPQRLLPRAHSLDPDGTVDQPMLRALAGTRGLAFADDYRGQRVLAAFGPVGDTGLAVEVKIDVDEFYLPLRERLVQWWHWFIAMALGGALLIASQMRPVAQRLVESENVARARAEALARSERALRELYNNLDEGIMVLKPDGTVEFVNPAGERLFGARPGELHGTAVAALIPEELREKHMASTRRFMEQGTSNVIGRGMQVFPALRRDGSRFDLEFSVAPMGQGERLRLVAVLRDVSARTALERMKGEFVATVNHELRTPLTSLLGSLDILAESEHLGADEREFLDMARRNGARLAALVNDVLDTERMASGSMRFDRDRIDLEPFLAEAVELNQAYAGARAVRIELGNPVPPVQIRGDRARLLQVMANLLSNACKFSPPGAAVAVRAAAAASTVRVEVVDRGPGIPEEFRDRIFTRFAQADASDARLKGGTGLGLAICKAIVERLGGRIGFESPAGGPTVFWFEMPLAGTAPPAHSG